MFLMTGKDILAMSNTIPSPDGSLEVFFQLNAEGKPLYSVRLKGKDVLKPSSLGLI